MDSFVTRRSVLMTGAAAIAMERRGLRGRCTAAEEGRDAAIRDQRGDAALDTHGSDTYATLHFAAPFYSTLLRFNLAKFPEVEGDLAASWTVAPDLMT